MEDIYDKITSGTRLNFDDGVRLYRYQDLAALGALANFVKERKNGNQVYYVKNLHINYTNICNKFCKFCSFYELPKSPSAYVLPTDEIRTRLKPYQDAGITEIHVVGGIYPRIPYEYYLELVHEIKSNYPTATLKAFTMVELYEMARISRQTIPEVINDLRGAGLDMFTGGGIEMLSNRVHRELFPQKINGDQWLELAKTCHQSGMPSNATMLYGHIETIQEKIDHMIQIRQLQDNTSGFLCFVPLSFHPESTQLEKIPGPSGCQDLREIAVSRLMLDNIEHIKTFWIMNSLPVSQIALDYGADDIDGTICRYEVTKDQIRGSDQQVSEKQLCELIYESGREPVMRNALYGAENSEKKRVVATTDKSKSNPVAGDKIAKKILNGKRLDFNDGLHLFSYSNITELGKLANWVRNQKHNRSIATYVVGRNINYTNICWVKCRFCAFYRKPGQKGGYLHSNKTIHAKIREMVDHGGIEVLMQGGLNPNLRIDYFETLFRSIKRKFNVILHALSPTEIIYIARRSRLSVSDTLRRLKQAGLDSIPGGGGELLVDNVRSRISPIKDHADDWLNVMRTAHQLDIPTTATMTYGFGETNAERLEHILRIRELQDETGGFTAFIPWNFQPDGTELGKDMGYKRTTGWDYLKTTAISRLMLDNIANIQASYVTQGAKVGQIGMKYGVNDFGSTMMEENVVSATGTNFLMSENRIRHLISEAGYTPLRRNTRYEIIEKIQDDAHCDYSFEKTGLMEPTT